MTLQEKIIKLRKKNGWSQEELADKIYVTRQAVSKWESGNSIPDVEKIVHMSKLFGVTTDYLLNDEIGIDNVIEESVADDKKILEQADVDTYFAGAKKRARLNAIGVALLAFSPVVYLILHSLAVENSILIGAIIGGISAFAGCAIFIAEYYAHSAIDKIVASRRFTLGFSVRTYVEQLQEAYHKPHKIQMITACTACVAVQVVGTALFIIYHEDLNRALLVPGIMLLLYSILIPIIVFTSMNKDGFSALLAGGKYSEELHKFNKVVDLVKVIIGICCIVAYVIYSAITGDWRTGLGCIPFVIVIRMLLPRIIAPFYNMRKRKDNER